jgi:flagellar motor protein MotB
MKDLALLAIVGILALGIGLSGCGKLSKTEFGAEMEKYNADSAAEHSKLREEVAMIGGKVDEQGNSLRSDISMAKNDAVAASEQGDADTIGTAKHFAKDQDAALHQDLTNAVNMARDKAQSFAMQEDDKLRMMIGNLDNKSKAQASDHIEMKSAIADVKEETETLKAMVAAKPTLIATVNFPSGGNRLSQEAKQKLNMAVKEIMEAHPDTMVKVIGHTDGKPVLSGRFRSNWHLSQARADAAVKYLKTQGVANDIESIGRAHTDPAASVRTKAGSAMNRRAEIFITPPAPKMM